MKSQDTILESGKSDQAQALESGKSDQAQTLESEKMIVKMIRHKKTIKLIISNMNNPIGSLECLIQKNGLKRSTIVTCFRFLDRQIIN